MHERLNTWVLEYLRIWIHRYLGAWVLRYLINTIRQALGYISIWVHHFLGTQFPRSMSPYIHGPYVHDSLGPWVLGYMVICAYTGTWVPILPKALCAQVVICQSTQVLMFPSTHHYLGTLVLRCKGTCVYLYMDPWVHGYWFIWVLVYMGTCKHWSLCLQVFRQIASCK